MIAIIAAVADNAVIGNLGSLPWKLPVDMHYFRDITIGNTVIMGRKTYESMGSPLPMRRNIVVTSGKIDGVETYTTLDDALAAARTDLKVFIIGGRRLYEEALPLANSLYITRVRTSPAGDTYFPEIDYSQWKLTARRFNAKDARNQFDVEFEFWTRKDRP